MSDILIRAQAPTLWKHFEEILKIPHGSGHEKALADYVLARAKALELPAKKDEAGNVIVRKPASAGKGIVAGSHPPGPSRHGLGEEFRHRSRFPQGSDQARHPRRLGPRLGTTLGADNGIGVAACLAILEDRSLVHGPLEFLFTSEEETGLNGARGIEPGA